METKDLIKENEELKTKHRELSKEYINLHFDYLRAVKSNNALRQEVLRLKELITLLKVSQNAKAV